jgi:hypothetical protein
VLLRRLAAAVAAVAVARRRRSGQRIGHIDGLRCRASRDLSGGGRRRRRLAFRHGSAGRLHIAAFGRIIAPPDKASGRRRAARSLRSVFANQEHGGHREEGKANSPADSDAQGYAGGKATQQIGLGRGRTRLRESDLWDIALQEARKRIKKEGTRWYGERGVRV